MSRQPDDTKRTLEQVLQAIKGSGGIKTVIAERLDVSWNTVQNYLDRWTTARAAYDAEEETTGDMAVSLIRQNIMLGLKNQKEAQQPVDSIDAWKWLKARRSKEYAESKDIDITSGGEKIRVVLLSDDDGS